MSRINTNINSLMAMQRLTINQTDLSTRLQRLSTGLRINTGKDDPAGLIASETLRSEIKGINQAVDNSQRANNVVNTAEGALSEISSLLLQVQALNNQASNTGAMSPDEIKANQLQVDAILTSINRISNTTQFNGQKLLNGALDYTTSGVNASDIDVASINGAKFVQGAPVQLAVSVLASAKTATVTYAASGIAGSPTTIEIAGNLGTQQLTFAGSALNSAVVAAVNQVKASTGVSAALSGTALRLDSTGYGASQYVSVTTISGSFANSKVYGTDASVTINGSQAEVDGKLASIRTGDLDVTLDLDKTFAQQTTASSTFYITGGGAKFQLGSDVNTQGQVNIGIGSVATTKLGNSVEGFLSSLGSGGANSLLTGNGEQAQRVLGLAIRQVATLRGRLGAFQQNVLETNINSLNVALENVTASESSIRDADFAKETAALTRAQILVQANTSVLAQANASPQNVLSLLQR